MVLAVLPRLDSLQKLGRVVFNSRWNQHGDIPADHLALLIAIEHRRALIPARDDPLQVRAKNGIVRRLDDGGQLGGLLLRPLAFRDVFRGTFIAENLARIIPDRPGVFPDEDHAAITPPPLALQSGDSSRFLQRFLELSPGVQGLEAFRVQIARLQIRIGRIAQHPSEGRIPCQNLPVRSRAVNSHRGVLKQGPIALLTLPESFLDKP